MKKLGIIALVSGGLVLAGCGDEQKITVSKGCQGHGGFGRDFYLEQSSNGHFFDEDKDFNGVVLACKDGAVVRIKK